MARTIHTLCFHTLLFQERGLCPGSVCSMVWLCLTPAGPQWNLLLDCRWGEEAVKENVGMKKCWAHLEFLWPDSPFWCSLHWAQAKASSWVHGAEQHRGACQCVSSRSVGWGDYCSPSSQAHTHTLPAFLDLFTSIELDIGRPCVSAAWASTAHFDTRGAGEAYKQFCWQIWEGSDG